MRDKIKYGHLQHGQRGHESICDPVTRHQTPASTRAQLINVESIHDVDRKLSSPLIR